MVLILMHPLIKIRPKTEKQKGIIKGKEKRGGER